MTAARAGLLAALDRDVTAVLPASADATAPARRGRRRASRAEMVLGGALGAALAALAVVLVTGGAGRGAPAAAPTTPARLAPTARPSAHQAAKPAAHPRGSATPAATRHASTLPPAAAAAAAFVGDLEAGAADGQVTQQAGQDLFNHLQPLLFGPPGQNAQQIQQQYAQLVQAYDQHQAQGQVTGSVATALRQTLNALGAALGTG